MQVAQNSKRDSSVLESSISPNLQEISTSEKKAKKVKVSKRKYKEKNAEPTSPRGVLKLEINELITKEGLSIDNIKNDMSQILNDQTVVQLCHRVVTDVTIEKLSSNGDGLALIPHPLKEKGKQVCVVPFGLPGDVVDVRVFKSHPLYVESDLLRVKKSSSYRDDSLIICKYFGKCSGCQFQNVDYSSQLELKKQTIINAYKFFAPNLSKEVGSLPEVSNTEPSPSQYYYRTKLTPHFNLPYNKPETFNVPSLGYESKGRPEWRETAGGSQSILDIEECVIGTKILNIGLRNERDRFQKVYTNYKKGATILLREDSNEPETADSKECSKDPNGIESRLTVTTSSGKSLVKSCVTNTRQIVTEHINDLEFQFTASEFFQNNNSILPSIIEYVKSKLPVSSDSKINLIDAYCGSGLFSIACSEIASKVIGVEVSADSVKFAELNAKNNNISNAKFIVGKAERIFENIDTPPENTSVILDPPRKGCDSVFLNQLSDFNPSRIVYISCNVHSQARDIEWFTHNTENGHKYKVESIKGFDFFPQTHHVESVAVLRLR